MNLWAGLFDVLHAITGKRSFSMTVELGSGYRKPTGTNSMLFKHFNLKDDPLMAGVADSTMSRLDEARTQAGVPFRITSGCRSAAKNATLQGAVKGSAHISGTDGFCHGLDLAVKDNHALFCMLLGLIKVGFRRIGIYVSRTKGNPARLVPRHIHVDDDSTKPQEVVWVLMEEN